MPGVTVQQLRRAAQYIRNDVRLPRRAHCLTLAFVGVLFTTAPVPELASQTDYSPENPGFFWGFAAGGSFKGGSATPSAVLPFGGFLDAFIGIRPLRYVSFRAEIGGAAIAKGVLGDVATTPPCGAISPCSGSRAGTLRLAFLGATVLFAGAGEPTKSIGFFSVGTAPYRVDHPAFHTVSQLGWNAGTVFELSQAKTRASLEIRFHRIPDITSDGRGVWLLPVTFGVTFF